LPKVEKGIPRTVVIHEKETRKGKSTSFVMKTRTVKKMKTVIRPKKIFKYVIKQKEKTIT